MTGLVLVLVLLAACIGPQPTATPAAPVPTLTPLPLAGSGREPCGGKACILFIGNSLTFYNDMPAMFSELARSGGHEVQVSTAAEGGWTLADHATSPATGAKLEEQVWDYVVLQEQSVIPSLPDERAERLLPAARVLVAKIRAGGGVPMLFMHWAHEDGLPRAGHADFDEMQAQLQQGIMEVAGELGSMVAPVGIAWQQATSQDPPLDLWQRDGLHPTRQGSYLAACVFYAVVFRQSPEGLAYNAGLPAETAQRLQAIAARTVLEDPAKWNLP